MLPLIPRGPRKGTRPLKSLNHFICAANPAPCDGKSAAQVFLMPPCISNASVDKCSDAPYGPISTDPVGLVEMPQATCAGTKFQEDIGCRVERT